MSWIDRLPRASFRDFEFPTDSHDSKGGRRLVVHEYPGSDTPTVEDFGEKSWDWSLSAYFIGPDYDLSRNEFLALLAEPGPEWLIHPWLGPLWVRIQGWSISESNDKGGYCTVKIDFVAGGEVRQPERDYRSAALAACEEAASAAVDEFELEPMSAESLESFIDAVNQRLDGLRQIVALAALPLVWAQTAMSVIAGVKADIAALVAIPRAFANRVLGIARAVAGLIDDIMAIPRAFRNAALGIANALGLSGSDDRHTSSGTRAGVVIDIPPASRADIVARIAQCAGTSRKAVTLTGASASDVVLLANLRAEYVLEQRLFACAALMLAVADYPSEAERDKALAAVEKAVTRLLPATPDEVFQPLVTARAAVIEALINQDVRPIVRRNIVRPLPAVLIAHGLGVDEEDFLARNAVRHPLFVNGEVYG
jgi:prophage DNA circulation protein